jgi:hypothetical protein
MHTLRVMGDSAPPAEQSRRVDDLGNQQFGVVVKGDLPNAPSRLQPLDEADPA